MIWKGYKTGDFIISDEESQKQVNVLNALDAFVRVCQRRAELDNYAIDDMRHEFLDYLGVKLWMRRIYRMEKED